MFKYGVTYKMYGMEVPMSPDEHYADLKRLIAAIGGKARRITVIMPMLYEGRQHRRAHRESLDCALMLQELVGMGVSNILTFDAHDPRICNAIPLFGFDNVQPTYQMIKALIRAVPDVVIDKDHVAMISPDEGAMHRCMYYSSVLGLDIGMFYKRRNYSVVVNGRNPIEAHEYLGQDLHGKDAIVVDDMISSGESMIDVCKQLKEKKTQTIAQIRRISENNTCVPQKLTTLHEHLGKLALRFFHKRLNVIYPLLTTAGTHLNVAIARLWA